MWEWLKKLFTRAPSGPDPVVSVPEAPTEPLWISIAKTQIGAHEVRGGENPKIIEYDSHTTLKATEDEVPWCSSFVCWCLDKAGLRSNRNAWAQSQATFGTRLDKPVYGCLVVFKWDASNGHVGFFAGWNSNGTMKILGGNQDNAVGYKNFSTGNVLAYRWPK